MLTRRRSAATNLSAPGEWRKNAWTRAEGFLRTSARVWVIADRDMASAARRDGAGRATDAHLSIYRSSAARHRSDGWPGLARTACLLRGVGGKTDRQDSKAPSRDGYPAITCEAPDVSVSFSPQNFFAAACDAHTAATAVYCFPAHTPPRRPGHPPHGVGGSEREREGRETAESLSAYGAQFFSRSTVRRRWFGGRDSFGDRALSRLSQYPVVDKTDMTAFPGCRGMVRGVLSEERQVNGVLGCASRTGCFFVLVVCAY